MELDNKQRECVSELNTEMKEIKFLLKRTQSPYESTELADLFAALAKAQLEMNVANTEHTNPYYKSKYADLTSVVVASRPFLAKNGLSVMQRVISNDEGKIKLFTRLCHASGQWIESNIPIVPLKPDIQSLGAYLTYLRRYMYASIVGVVVADEDDDGEKAMEGPRSQGLAIKKVSLKITREQLEILSQQIHPHPDILEKVLSKNKITKLSDLPDEKFDTIMSYLKELKKGK